MNWWLLYNHDEIEPNKRYIQFYFDACSKRNIDLKLIDRDMLGIVCSDETTFLYNEEIIENPDVVINRTRDYVLAKSLEMSGCRLFNNSQITLLGNNKLLANQFVNSLGVRTMKTCYGSYEGLEFPFVAKSLDGHGGTEVFLVNDEHELKKLIAEIDVTKYIFQQPASQLGKDLRVYIVGGQIVAGMLRTSDIDFRSNFCLGGKAESYELSPVEKEVVEKIVRSLKIGHCGIDFIFDKGELVFNEIEDVVGSRMLYTYTNFDVVDEYVDHIMFDGS